MDLGASGHEQLGNNNDQQQPPQQQQQHQPPPQQQQQQPQYQHQQSSSAVATTPLSPLRPAPMGAASMMQAASTYYSTPPSMHAHHHDLASATKMSSKLTHPHAASGNGLGSGPLSKSGNDHKTSDQVVTDQAREILRQAVVTAVTESNKAAAVANNNSVAKAASKPGIVRYRECQKNHAASIGGHAIDGCGEFLPGDDGDGEGDALRCAACDCHRNFHRREVEGECDCRRKLSKAVGLGIGPPSSGAAQQGASAPPVTTLALTGGGGQMTPLTMAAAMSAGGPTDSDDQDDGPGHFVTSGGMMMSMRSPSAIKKRFRTKFTTEQKDKMLAFAEKVGWRIQKHDEAAVHEFCATVGVKRHVLKVWMHNNKHTMGKKP